MNLEFGVTSFENLVYIKLNKEHESFSLKQFSNFIAQITNGEIKISKPYKITNAIKIFDKKNPLLLKNVDQRRLLAKTLKTITIGGRNLKNNVNDLLQQFSMIEDVNNVSQEYINGIVNALKKQQSPSPLLRKRFSMEDEETIEPLQRLPSTNNNRSLARQPSRNIMTGHVIDNEFSFYYNNQNIRENKLKQKMITRNYNRDLQNEISIEVYLRDKNNEEEYIRFEENIINFTAELISKLFGNNCNLKISLNDNNNTLEKIIKENDIKSVCKQKVAPTYLYDHGYNIFILIKNGKEAASFIAVNFEKRPHFYFYYDDTAAIYEKFKDNVYDSDKFDLFYQLTSYISVVCNNPDKAPKGTGSKLIETIKQLSFKLGIDTVTLESLFVCQSEKLGKSSTKKCTEYLHEFYLKRKFVFDIDEFFVDSDVLEKENNQKERIKLLTKQLQKNSSLGTKFLNIDDNYNDSVDDNENLQDILNKFSKDFKFFNIFEYKKNKRVGDQSHKSINDKIEKQINKINELKKTQIENAFYAKHKSIRRRRIDPKIQKKINEEKITELLIPMVYFLNKSSPLNFVHFGEFYKKYKNKQKARRKYELAILHALNIH
jgi:hypothetical protein